MNCLNLQYDAFVSSSSTINLLQRNDNAIIIYLEMCSMFSRIKTASLKGYNTTRKFYTLSGPVCLKFKDSAFVSDHMVYILNFLRNYTGNEHTSTQA